MNIEDSTVNSCIAHNIIHHVDKVLMKELLETCKSAANDGTVPREHGHKDGRQDGRKQERAEMASQDEGAHT